jgi:tRNA G18 (ribose-2'-O)-methylase SpoU
MSDNIRKLTFSEIFARQPNLAELKDIERMPIYTLAEDIRSMHNVGSLFRTSDGVRLAKLFLSGYTAQPPRKEIDKTALGATDSVPWEYYKDPVEVVRKLKRQGTRIIALEHTSKSVSYSDFQYNFPMCLVVGNEVDGVSQKILSLSDAAVEIPMHGIKQSLNVSVAYGIVIYHILDNYLKNLT